MKLEMYKYTLQLRQPVTIAIDSFEKQDTLIAALSYQGYTGYGEATVEPYYGVSYESMISALQLVQPLLSNYTFINPEKLWADCQEYLGEEPFAQCALDCAAYDLWAKLQKRPTYDVLGLIPDNNPVSNYTISIDTIPAMVANLQAFSDWPIFKIKLGTNHDLAIVQALRDVTDKPFRVDANTGWTADQALDFAPTLQSLGVEFIEQPLAPTDTEGASMLFKNSRLPIIADESCVIESDVERCVGSFHGINIKLMKCGGITPALRMIKSARVAGLKVMVGCMAESSVGLSAIGSILPLLDFVDMDSVALLAEDIADGVVVKQGHCLYSSGSGHVQQLTKEPIEIVN